MESSTPLRELFFWTWSSTNFSKSDQELWENRYFSDRAPWDLSKISPWSWLKARAPMTFYCIPHRRCKFSNELHDFFRVSISSSKLHDFYANSLSNSMEICKLRSELHETRPKKSVLILIGKIRCFLKSLRFWTFFSSQLEAPQELTEGVKKPE